MVCEFKNNMAFILLSAVAKIYSNFIFKYLAFSNDFKNTTGHCIVLIKMNELPDEPIKLWYLTIEHRAFTIYCITTLWYSLSLYSLIFSFAVFAPECCSYIIVNVQHIYSYFILQSSIILFILILVSYIICCIYSPRTGYLWFINFWNVNKLYKKKTWQNSMFLQKREQWLFIF